VISTALNTSKKQDYNSFAARNTGSIFGHRQKCF